MRRKSTLPLKKLGEKNAEAPPTGYDRRWAAVVPTSSDGRPVLWGTTGGGEGVPAGLHMSFGRLPGLDPSENGWRPVMRIAGTHSVGTLGPQLPQPYPRERADHH
jgi:hypothetical protein